MKKILVGAIVLALGAGAQGFAQSLEDLNIQIHGYATQGFLYTTNNNILTTHSSDGSPAWTEAVLNVGASPISKLRIGVQGRFFLLGNFGNTISLDWAAADYKVDDRLGFRFGKVKTPSGLFNDIQDIDPSYIWSLLPQSIYTISNRDGVLAHYGAVAYGTFSEGGKLGKLEYRGWAGNRRVSGDDGYFVVQTEAGIVLPNGFSAVTSGVTLRWVTPLKGLMIGVTGARNNMSVSKLTAGGGALNGSETVFAVNQPSFFARYEKNKVMVASEYTRLPGQVNIGFSGLPPSPNTRFDYKEWYAMASYKLTGKLTAGIYDSQQFNRQAALGPARYSKDWTFSGRYDFSQYLYAKAEEHFIDGTAVGYDTDLNPNGLKPNTKLTILKVGVSF
jgi:hypothetical protein